MAEILEEIKKRKVFFDGGTGSLLQANGLEPGELPETWNVKHPDIITKLHRDYLEAGADIIKTNTFGANGLKFYKGAEFDLEEVVTAALKMPGMRWRQRSYRQERKGVILPLI